MRSNRGRGPLLPSIYPIHIRPHCSQELLKKQLSDSEILINSKL